MLLQSVEQQNQTKLIAAKPSVFPAEIGRPSMFKFIQSLILLSLSIPVLTNPVLAKEHNNSKVSTKHQTLKLYNGLFPYDACLQVTINKVAKKPDKVLLLKATVEDSYLGSYKKGSQLAVSFYGDNEGQKSFSFLSTLKNTKQIIAFNHWPKDADSFEDLVKASKNPIYSLWIPYAEMGFKSHDIALLKSIIKDTPTRPAQARATFQKLLETKWTTARINDFCRPETQRNWLGASEHCANSSKDWSDGTLHANKVPELGGKTVEWQASVNNNIPTSYNIKVVYPNKNHPGWDLEIATPSLEEWTDENFLLHRVRHSIYQAAFAHWILNHDLHPASTQYRSLLCDVSKETLGKDKTGYVTSYNCHLNNGKTLTAILTIDRLQSIDKILINGKLDSGWTEMYKNNLVNFAKCKVKMSQQ